jgi:catechol 2,3-dioxygenase-like lactoylglutathione lyase family enzyme
MSIIPTVRCRRMQTSIDFYTNVLDFQCVEHGGGFASKVQIVASNVAESIPGTSTPLP